MNKIYNGDCLDIMSNIPDASIDLVLCDLPYGKTKNSWDSIIPLDKLWEQYNRVCKKDNTIILFGAQPFTTTLINSNLKDFKQSLVWYKGKGTDPLTCNKRIMSSHEDIVIFRRGKVKYTPQMQSGTPYKAPRTGGNHTNSIIGGTNKDFSQKDNSGYRHPLSVLEYHIHCGSKRHPNEKPVELLEFLIKSYSNEGDIILDNTAGSGGVGVAAINTNRQYVLIEKDPAYYGMCVERCICT